MKDYDVVLCSGAEHLRDRFEDHGFRVLPLAKNYDGRRIFPNGDIYTRLPRVERLSNRKVIVIQACTGSGPAEPESFSTADRLIELLLVLDLLSHPVEVEESEHKYYKATPVEAPSSIEVVLTFQPFALQDKTFKTGEAVSARWAIELLARTCRKTWVVNPHATESLDWVRSLTEKNLLQTIDITSDLISFGAKQFGFDEYLVVTPDEGGQERFDVAGFGKSRMNSFNIELHGDIDVTDKNVIVVDDLTKSGTTLLKAADRLRKQGARDVGLVVAHVLPLVGIGEDLLENLLEKSRRRIVSSNSIRTIAFCVKNPVMTYNIVDTLVKVL